MIQLRSMLEVADNSGAKKLQCIRVLGGTRRRYGYVGDIIVCSVKAAMPQAEIKKGDVVRIVECRPLSKAKKWRLTKIIERAK